MLHLLIRRDKRRVQCVFNCVFIIKITKEDKMGVQQYKLEEIFIVINTLHICNHLLKTQISSREPLSHIAWPTGIIFIHGSAMFSWISPGDIYTVLLFICFVWLFKSNKANDILFYQVWKRKDYISTIYILQIYKIWTGKYIKIHHGRGLYKKKWK